VISRIGSRFRLPEQRCHLAFTFGYSCQTSRNKAYHDVLSWNLYCCQTPLFVWSRSTTFRM